MTSNITDITPRRETLPIGKLHPNTGQLADYGIPKNPRFIRNDKYRALLDSITEDPDMMEVREVAVYDTGNAKTGYVVVGGNMRFRAAKELGYKEVPCKIYPTETPPDKLRRFILKDNNAFGGNDWDELANWNPDEIASAAIDIPNIDFNNGDDEEQGGEEGGNAPGSGNGGQGNKEKQRTHIFAEGDVWQLGKHYLICRSKEDLSVLGEIADYWEAKTGKAAVLLGNGLFKEDDNNGKLI